MDEYYNAVSKLPGWLKKPLSAVSPQAASKIHEIRMRSGSPLFFTVQGRRVSAEEYCPEIPAMHSLILTADAPEDILFSLCGGSVHAFEDELSKGYFTLPGGHRVGVGGRYFCNEHGKAVLQRVESLNLRIARSVRCVLSPGLQKVLSAPFTGLLIVGEPDSGKTTVLRSVIPALSARRRTAVVIDEREEILPETIFGGFPTSECDRIAGLEKSVAVEMALRTLGPQVILLDELGSLRETCQLEQGFFSGVDFIATLHAATLEEAEQKPQVKYLLAHGMLRHMYLLAGRETPGQICKEKDYPC